MAAEITFEVPYWNWPLWTHRANPADLVAFQLATSPSHSPRKLKLERFTSETDKATLPAIAIVTPSLNQRVYLRETVHSVCEQVGVNVTYLVQDGGSTDGTLQEVSDFPARVSWRSEPDFGQADAISRAFGRTTGDPSDLMAWINSDDFYMPGALRFVASYFARNPHVDVIYGHRVLVDEGSREIGRWFLPPHDDQVLRLNDFVPQETVFWRRRVWDKAGGIDASFRFAMDWDLLLRFQAAGAKIVRVPFFLACFRIHSFQKTSSEMKSTGQREIDALRLRTFGRTVSSSEVGDNLELLAYLRKSAWIELLWRRFGVRHP